MREREKKEAQTNQVLVMPPLYNKELDAVSLQKKLLFKEESITLHYITLEEKVSNLYMW